MLCSNFDTTEKYASLSNIKYKYIQIGLSRIQVNILQKCIIQLLNNTAHMSLYKLSYKIFSQE